MIEVEVLQVNYSIVCYEYGSNMAPHGAALVR